MSSLTEAELVDMGLASLAEIFDLPAGPHQAGSRRLASDQLGQRPVRPRRLFLRHPQTRDAQSALKEWGGGTIFFSGEALYAGPDMGTVEAALASGQETAQTILTRGW